MFEFIIVFVDIDPPMFEVKTFADELSVFGTERFVMVAFEEIKFVKKALVAPKILAKKLVLVAFVMTELLAVRPVTLVVASVAVFVAVRFPTVSVPPVAVPKNRLEMYDVKAFNIFVKKLLLVAFTLVRF